MFFRKKPRLVRNTFSCPKRWDDLEGDDFVRTCQTCSYHVFNLTGLSDEETLQFIQAHDGKVCALVHTDRQGFVVNGACRDEAKPRPVARLGVIAAVPRNPQGVVKEKVAHQLQLAEQRVKVLRKLADLLAFPKPPAP